MKQIIYWSPCLSNVGTIKSTLNSAVSLANYKNKEYTVKIINICGEWDRYKDYIVSNKIKLIDLTFNYFKYLPKEGYLSSRFSYIAIFLISFFPLLFFLAKEKRKAFFVSHLVTSLPLFFSIFFHKKINFILRISGYPKLNIIRKFYWKFISKKIIAVTCPTLELKTQLEKQKIFEVKKLFFLPDAILNIKDFATKKKENIKLPHDKKFILAVGRLTKQKNYIYMINELAPFLLENNNYNLIILGDGEHRKEIKKEIIRLNIFDKVIMIGHVNNPYAYMKKSSVLVLSSLWEEVGFVLVESALSNLLVISSNCKNGPKEFLSNGKAGYLFENNEKNQLKKEILKIKLDNFEKKVFAKKNASKYTKFRHFLRFEKIINELV